MAELICPHCRGTRFDKNPFFLECCDCGSRYVLDEQGGLRRTTAFGYGQGTSASAQAAQAAYAPEPDSYEFDSERSTRTRTTINYNYNVNVDYVPVSTRRRSVTLLLSIFLGMVGAHYFYLGRWGMGLLWLFTGGLGGVGWIVDIFRIALFGIKDRNGLPVG